MSLLFAQREGNAIDRIKKLLEQPDLHPESIEVINGFLDIVQGDYKGDVLIYLPISVSGPRGVANFEIILGFNIKGSSIHYADLSNQRYAELAKRIALEHDLDLNSLKLEKTIIPNMYFVHQKDNQFGEVVAGVARVFP